jgi:alkanesulfonate monooxygenase SsuD/methylene tetrahydromethanopterin reductase-like flavin-dependent oxidoreductase (luciferase family)
MKFSLFDWLDESGRPYAETYEDRLKLLESIDGLGFHAYLLAEHHGTSLSTAPSPALFLAAAAQRTKTLRLGTLSFVLPIYDPLRLYEEVCMLDHLTGGRLELGVSRGASPHESLRHGVVREQSKARFEESFALMLQGFTEGRFHLEGRFHRYDNLKTRFRPLQQPYPPIWYPTSSPDSISYAAKHGFHFAVSLMNISSIAKVAEMLKKYRDEYERQKREPGRLNAHAGEPEMAFSTHVYVGDTDAKARDEMRAAYTRFNENYTRRYVEIGQADHFAGRPSFEQFVEQNRILCGSPDTVRATLQRLRVETGANHFVGVFTFGDLSLAKMQASARLFAKEVIPALRA